HHSRIPREQLAEVAKVNRTVREYLAELEQENPVEPPVPQQDKVSTTDPDSTFATKGGPARLGYYDNYLVDNRQLHHRGCASYPGTTESREHSGARHDRTISRTPRLPAANTGGRYHLRQWGASAVA